MTSPADHRQTTRRYRIILALSLLLITYLATFDISETPLVTIHDKLQHLGSFIWLAFFLDFSLPSSHFNTRKFVILFLYGLGLELIQQHLPYRQFSISDMIANSAGLVFYLLVHRKLYTLPRFHYRLTAIGNTGEAGFNAPDDSYNRPEDN